MTVPDAPTGDSKPSLLDEIEFQKAQYLFNMKLNRFIIYQ
jgi:hypothetical protein